MRAVTVRLDDELAKDLDMIKKRRGFSLDSEAVRVIIREAATALRPDTLMEQALKDIKKGLGLFTDDLDVIRHLILEEQKRLQHT